MKKIFIVLLMSMLLFPLASAYAVGLPAMNLWDFFVETVFGSFWISVIGLAGIFFIILMLGGISAWTNLTYQMVFLLAMAIGYGQAIVTVPLWVALVSWSVFQLIQYLGSSNR